MNLLVFTLMTSMLTVYISVNCIYVANIQMFIPFINILLLLKICISIIAMYLPAEC